MTDACASLDLKVSAFDLLQHPFYLAWSAGTLPKEALVHYTAEYGHFIRTLGAGWSTLGETGYAQEEDAHARLWDRFAHAMGTKVEGTTSTIAEVNELVATANDCFTNVPSTIGALYAFEAQQPKTAQSKLEGLEDHYNVTENAKAYFRVHAKDEEEHELLSTLYAALSPSDQSKAEEACSTMSRALWNALSGIYPHADCTRAAE